eukprot:1162014-Pelagomonas_calceolata.AAC.2
MQTYSYPPEGSVQLKAELSSAVRKAIGAIASLDAVHWVRGIGVPDTEPCHVLFASYDAPCRSLTCIASNLLVCTFV